MYRDCYTWPTVKFIGGDAHSFVFTLYSNDGTIFAAPDALEYNFALVDYCNRNYMEPIISIDYNSQVRDYRFRFGTSGDIQDRVIVTLANDDTKDLYGKYIYQLTIKKTDGTIRIPGQGIAEIFKNINPG